MNNSHKKMSRYVIVVFFWVISTQAQEITLQFKPYNEAVYFIWLGQRHRREWVVISKLQEIEKSSQEMSFSWETVDSDLPPPDDLITLVPEIVFTPKGRKNFAQPPDGVFKIENGQLVTDAILDFPVLPEDRTTYTIGETIEIPMSIPVRYDYDEDMNFTGPAEIDVVLIQKISAIEEHLGFTCAKIEYSIEHWNGEIAFNTPKYELRGELFFAI
ncbi:hypothetical protein QA601_18780, partial [Chitinispirillales bacterium ANBcel5]|uniref:hypothetical protein n=1 Tax=Cellulosispirillum alkaliphilum TaxID=3039283 RepID=UPI002A52D4DD|nr:hypothetical protein [Chitinispirillales bacterium ANBcel5]